MIPYVEHRGGSGGELASTTQGGIDAPVSAAILAAILENMQLMLLTFTYSYSTTFTLYEWTLYLSLYLKGELRYIRFGISAAMLAAILENFFFTYFQIPDHIPVK